MATTAVYPSDYKTWSERTDLLNVVVAADVNTIYAEVSAIENALGTALLTTSTWSGTYDGSSPKTWTNAALRIANIEYGLNTALNNRVSTTGNTTITSTSTNVGLTVQTTGTGDLIQFKNTGGTVITQVTKDGWIAAIDGGAAN